MIGLAFDWGERFVNAGQCIAVWQCVAMCGNVWHKESYEFEALSQHLLTPKDDIVYVIPVVPEVVVGEESKGTQVERNDLMEREERVWGQHFSMEFILQHHALYVLRFSTNP